MPPAFLNIFGNSTLGHRLRAGPSQAWQRLNDWWLNIETTHNPEHEPEVHERDGEADYWCHYQGANYLHLYQIAHLLTDGAANTRVFYDIGCGKGRPLCVMARYPFVKVVGVELRQELCTIAENNARNLRGRVAPIEVRCEDAAASDISDGDIFFFFNPFGPPTFKHVLAAIERSLEVRPRKLTLIYYNAVFEEVFQACSWLERVHVLPTLSGLRVSFWHSRPRPAQST